MVNLSYSHKPHEPIGYYPLSINKMVDVFLRDNEYTEENEDGIQYVAEEIYFRVDESVTKKIIEDNFHYFWKNKGEKVESKIDEVQLLKVQNQTLVERTDFLEDVITEIIITMFD